MTGPLSPIKSYLLSPLARGGVLVSLPDGPVIQFGIPGETVKDASFQGKFPDLYIADPGTMFDPVTGRIAEVEFPMYFGFFVRNKLAAPTRYATPAAYVTKLDTILKTSYYGKYSGFSNEDLEREYPQGKNTPGFPDMLAEMAHWKSFPIDKLREIHSIDDQAGLMFQGAIITYLGDSLYGLEYKGEFLGTIDVKRYAFPPLTPRVNTALHDQHFWKTRHDLLFKGTPMVIPIHSSSGFDPKSGTASHMIWNRGKVVLLDPPADILEFLITNHIPLEAIDGVMLTHVHGDHDVGSLQVLLNTHHINLYTTYSVHHLYLDKLEALTNNTLSREQLEALWNFVPLTMLTPTVVNGLNMKFVHGFHSIPAFGYEISDESGKPILSYSGDTFNDPSVYDLVDKGVISSRERAQHIVELPFASARKGGFSIHEQGEAPLHTPPTRLQGEMTKLAQDEIPGRVFGYHSSEDALSAQSIPLFGDGQGLQNGIELPLATIPLTSTEIVTRALNSLPLFHGISKEALMRLASLGEIKTWKKDDVLIRQGEKNGSTSYLLLDGHLQISKAGEHAEKQLAVLSQGIVGEGALFGEARNATITALDEVTVLEWNRDTLLPALESLGLVDRLRRLRETRLLAYDAITHSPQLKDLHQTVIDSLLLIAEPVIIPQHTVLETAGDTTKDVYMVVDGELFVSGISGKSKQLKVVATRRSGDIVGEMALINNTPRTATIQTGDHPATMLRFPATELREALKQYPSLNLTLTLMAQAHKTPAPSSLKSSPVSSRASKVQVQSMPVAEVRGASAQVVETTKPNGITNIVDTDIMDSSTAIMGALALQAHPVVAEPDLAEAEEPMPTQAPSTRDAAIIPFPGPLTRGLTILGAANIPSVPFMMGAGGISALIPTR